MVSVQVYDTKRMALIFILYTSLTKDVKLRATPNDLMVSGSEHENQECKTQCCAVESSISRICCYRKK